MKSIKTLLLVSTFLITGNAWAGVLHPCTGGSLETVKLGSVQLQSADGQLQAVLEMEKVLDINCINVINDYFNVNAKVTKVSDGLTIFPVSVEMTLQTLDGNGKLIDNHDTQAPLKTGIRLLDGSKTVNINLAGFGAVNVEI